MSKEKDNTPTTAIPEEEDLFSALLVGDQKTEEGANAEIQPKSEKVFYVSVAQLKELLDSVNKALEERYDALLLKLDKVLAQNVSLVQRLDDFQAVESEDDELPFSKSGGSDDNLTKEVPLASSKESAEEFDKGLEKQDDEEQKCSEEEPDPDLSPAEVRAVESSSWKLFLIVSAILLAVALLGLGLYNILFSSSSSSDKLDVVGAANVNGQKSTSRRAPVPSRENKEKKVVTKKKASSKKRSKAGKISTYTLYTLGKKGKKVAKCPGKSKAYKVRYRDSKGKKRSFRACCSGSSRPEISPTRFNSALEAAQDSICF